MQDVQQPNIIKKYNEGMGGVVVLDKLLESYRSQLRSKNGGGTYLAMH